MDGKISQTNFCFHVYLKPLCHVYNVIILRPSARKHLHVHAIHSCVCSGVGSRVNFDTLSRLSHISIPLPNLARDPQLVLKLTRTLMTGSRGRTLTSAVFISITSSVVGKPWRPPVDIRSLLGSQDQRLTEAETPAEDWCLFWNYNLLVAELEASIRVDESGSGDFGVCQVKCSSAFDFVVQEAS